MPTENSNHYDVLGVPRNVDQAAIRKAYLRASLRSHPDKNPGREEEAKAEFVKIGQAYAVLNEPAQRASYDRELAAGKFFRYSRPQQQRRQQQKQQSHQSRSDAHSAAQSDASTGTDTSTKHEHDEQADDEFDQFMNQFDETVSGMSEEELNMAMGAAAAVGSIIGSILGARAMKGNNSLLSSVASMAGSAMASHAASTLVKTVHEDSKQRVLERDERRAAIARGEPVPESSARESRDRVFQDAGRAFQKVAGAAVGGGGPSPSTNRANAMNSFMRDGTASTRGRNSSGGDGGQQGFSWQQAAKLACMAAEACAEMKSASK